MNRSIMTRVWIVVLTLALCGVPELLAQSAQTLPNAPSASRLLAQNAAPQATDANAEQNPSNAPQNADQPRVVAVDPQKAAGTEDEQQDAVANDQPGAPSRTLAPADAADLRQLESVQKQNEPTAAPIREHPLGTATAEKGRTAGGGASRPAGVAIAPAKQKRSRSLLIKLGAIVAAGAAVGTVYALSRGTNGVPAGAVGR